MRCGEAAARLGNAQAVTFYRPISKSRSGEMRGKLKVMGGVTEEKGPGGAAAEEGQAARGKRPCPNVRQQRRVPSKEVGNEREPAAR